jgi:hypothetical protein
MSSAFHKETHSLKVCVYSTLELFVKITNSDSQSFPVVVLLLLKCGKHTFKRNLESGTVVTVTQRAKKHIAGSSDTTENQLLSHVLTLYFSFYDVCLAYVVSVCFCC